MKQIKINNKVYNIPENYSELKLKELVQLDTIKKQITEETQLIDVVYAIAEELWNISPKEIDSLDLNIAHQLISILKEFILKQPNTLPIDKLKLIEIKGKQYSYDINFSNWKFKEFIDFDYLLKNSPTSNISKLLAIFIRPIKNKHTFISKLKSKFFKHTSPYTIEDYDYTKLEERAKLLEEHLSAEQGYSLLVFFWTYIMIYLQNLEPYLNEQIQKMTHQLQKNNKLVD